ncbi:MAG: adenylyltransferase/cytidyltransferase family protein [Acidobacteria bacterium]|nr:adenylyltransferase/cytidyltransferase family protein [Acidobacteriota bacterium]
MKKKIVTAAEAEAIIRQTRREGKVVVMANGCFDLIHVGHIRYLQAARQMGDLLVVALNSDAGIRQLKGSGRPIMNQHDRSVILAAMEMVDWIVIFDEPDVRALLRRLRPDIQVKGTDYTEETVPEREVVLGYGGRVRIAGDPKDHSTRDLIADIIAHHE